MGNTSKEAREAERSAKRYERAGRCVEWALESSVERAGGLLLGLTLKNNGYDWLLVIKASFDGRPMVAFSQGLNPASCFVKATAEVGDGKLRWKDDEFAKRFADSEE